MSNKTNTEEAASNKDELNKPEVQGKKAIEADREINKQDKTEDQKNKEEKKDAEQWRNEG